VEIVNALNGGHFGPNLIVHIMATGKRSSLLNSHTSNNSSLYPTQGIKMGVRLGQVHPSTSRVISSNHIVLILVFLVYLKLLPCRTLLWVNQEDKKDNCLKDPNSLHPLPHLFQKILLNRPHLITPQLILAFAHRRIQTANVNNICFHSDSVGLK
jgi:hypothetical protein